MLASLAGIAGNRDDDAALLSQENGKIRMEVYDTTGQICMNAKRLFVHESWVDEAVQGLSARLEKVKLGYGLDQATTTGPLHSPAQKSFVDSLIREARESGAQVLEFVNCRAATCRAATSSAPPSFRGSVWAAPVAGGDHR
jgi:acyl-CoA reductase-like NAD-dependent aldehyde dehydrogenase